MTTVPRNQPIAASGSVLKLFTEVKFLLNNLGNLPEGERHTVLSTFSRVLPRNSQNSQDLLVRSLWEIEQTGTGELLELRGRLSSLVEGRVPFDTARISQEKELLEGIRGNVPFVDRFEKIETLRGLYLRNLLRGGHIGMLLLRETEKKLTKRVEEESLYPEFISFHQDGTALLKVPPDVKRPSVLKLPDNQPRPRIIFVRGEGGGGIGTIAYFHIPDLSLGQKIVTDKGVDQYRKDLRSGKSFDPLTISYDRNRNLFHVWDGTHRLLAAGREGFSYILGKVAYPYPLSGKPLKVGDLRIVTPEEFGADAASRGEGASYISLLLSPSDEE